MSGSNERPVFTVTLRPEPGVDPLPALRAALKRLLRDHGLRCTHVAKVPDDEREGAR